MRDHVKTTTINTQGLGTQKERMTDYQAESTNCFREKVTAELNLE